MRGITKGEAVFKSYTASSVKGVGKPQDRKVRFVISTETRDRHRDVVMSDGWDLKAYRKNGVVLFGHDHRSPPIGKATQVGVQDRQLKATVEFADAETYAFADTIYRLYLGGYMKAASVGFIPKKFEHADDNRGLIFLEQELIEFSAVPVPANPDALVEAKSTGLNIVPLADWAERILDLDATGPLVSPSDLDGVRRIARNGRAVFQAPTPRAAAPAPPQPKLSTEEVLRRVAEGVTSNVKRQVDDVFLRRTGRLPR